MGVDLIHVPGGRRAIVVAKLAIMKTRRSPGGGRRGRREAPRDGPGLTEVRGFIGAFSAVLFIAVICSRVVARLLPLC